MSALVPFRAGLVERQHRTSVAVRAVPAARDHAVAPWRPVSQGLRRGVARTVRADCGWAVVLGGVTVAGNLAAIFTAVAVAAGSMSAVVVVVLVALVALDMAILALACRGYR